MAEKYYDENNEELGQIVNNESAISKFIKAGIVTAAVTTVAKKGATNWVGRTLAKEPIQYAAIAAGTMALSGDDDIGGDLAVASSLVFGAAGIKTMRSALDTAEGLARMNKAVKTLDEKYIKNISLNLFSFNDKVMDTFKTNIAKRAVNAVKDEEPNSSMIAGAAKTLFSQGKMISGAVLDTITTPMDNFKKFGLVEGFKQNIKNISNTSIMREYEQMDDIQRTAMIRASNMTKGFSNTDVFKDDPGMVREALGGLAGFFNKDAKTIFDYSDESFDENLTKLKKLNKIHSIKNNTIVSDSLGMYTKFDETTGMMKLDVRRLGSEESSNFDMISSLYGNYVKDQRAVMKNTAVRDEFGNKVINEAGKTVYKNGFDSLSAEQKEQGFVKYLNDNGFEEFVSKNYKQKDAVTYADVNEMFKGKSLSTESHLKALEARLQAGLKTGSITQESFDARMLQITEARGNRVDSDVLDYIHNNLDSSNLKKILDVDAENQYSHGVKNADVLKNFTFTNVVTKNDVTGFTDKTALDGSITAMRIGALVEQNMVGTFKIPFVQRAWNTWNPLKLLDSENRIKTKIANDFNPYGITSNGYIVDGKLIQHQRYQDADEVVRTATGKVIERIKGEKHSEYFSNGKKTYSRTFLKDDIDTLDENYEILKANEKSVGSYKDIYATYKAEGWRAAMDKASKTHINPFNIRYDEGVGIRAVNPKEAYYNEAPIWQGIFNGNAGGSRIINNMDEKGKTTGFGRRVANMILGEHGDINGRDLAIDNKFIDDRYDSAKQILVSQLLKQNVEKAKVLQSDPSFKQQVLNNYGQENFVRNLLARSSANTDIYSMADSVYGRSKREIIETLKNAAKDQVYSTDLIEKAEQIFDNNQASGTAFMGLITGIINDKKDGYEEISKFIASNKESFTRFMSIGDLKFATKNGMMLENGTYFDPGNVTKEFVSYIDNAKSTYGIDYLETLVGNAIKFTNTKTAKSFGNHMNTTLGTLGISDKPVDEFIEQMYGFIKKVDYSRNNAANSLGKEILRNQVITGTDIGNDIIDMLKRRAGETDELRDAMNLSLGYEYSHLSDDKALEMMNQLSDAYRNANYKGELGDIAKSLNSGDRDYSKSSLSIFTKKDFTELNSNPRSYNFFKELDRNTGMVEGKHDTYLEAVEILRQAKYVTRKEMYGASMIVEDSIKNAMEVRGAMDATRRFVQSFMSKNKLSFYSSKAIAGSGEKIASQSKRFGEAESTFGLFMKKAIKRVQDPLEFIGVERITNAQLGSHWSDQYKNFFKYRYIPLAAAVTGYLAVDSATDAIVPDDVPIFGNGITGVATRTYATARVGVQYGLKYTGLLSAIKAIDEIIPVDNGLTWMLDLTMDPEEMIDVYFRGKAVRVNKNRNWYTAGRQSGEGEEFGQYRPHLLYTLGNPTAGIYDNKFEKFFRQDNLLTKYPWYILDPYKEERDAFEKFGAAYPKTEQMFKDIPMFGHLLSATIGEIIKPTRYIAEELWRVGDNMMKNPGYNPNDPTSPEFIKFEEPNKMLTSFFDFVEDYKTFSGMHGYLIGKGTEAVFGATNPYKDDVVLDSIDNDTNMVSRYERLEAGGMFGTTEGIRRLLDGESLGTISMNPLEQRLPDWMPEFFKKGKNPYMKTNFGEYILPGEAFDESANATGNESLDRMKTLSMIAPYSSSFDDLKRNIYSNFNELSKDEQQSFYESLGYASEYGKRDYDDTKSKAKDVINKTVKIDQKLSYNEFISEGKRYKIDNVESDFNALSERLGASRATNLINKFNQSIVEGEQYTFSMSTDAQYSVGMDRDGDFIKVAAQGVSDKIKGESVYNDNSSLLAKLATPITMSLDLMMDNAMTADLEKVFGKKTAYQEWSQETVQSPYFRDWDNSFSSFVEPYFNFSSNSMVAGLTLGRANSDVFLNSNATFDMIGGLINAGRFNMVANKLTGGVSRSSSYEDDAEVNRELQKIKTIAGDKSYYNMNGLENLKQIQGIVNENDAGFIEDLINTSNGRERESILKEADSITSNVLKQVWNRHQELIGNQNSDRMYEIEKETFDEVIDIGAYVGDPDQARLALKSALNIGKSKLDAKRIGMIRSYRGGLALEESEIIKQRMYKGYNSKTVTTSTIYPNGTININRRD